MKISFFVSVVALLSSAPACAQVIDLYARMTDPRGIARLTTPDSTRTKSINFHGDAKWATDTIDGIPDVAKDTGSGVITHIWSACADPDSTVTLWLYLNDTLVLSGKYGAFFTMLHGLFRPPLDTSAHGANTWDVQIPYHHGFRLAMVSTGGNVYWAVEWHWVPESVLPWISLHAPTIPPTQSAAEADFFDTASQWRDSDAVILSRTDTIRPRSALTLADISGPAMLEELHFTAQAYDSTVLDSTWLNIYWDKSPTASVHVPLMDFFLCPVNVNVVRALHLHADPDSGFISYFPMPFAVHARVELVRTGSTPLVIGSAFQYHLEPVDRNQYGYFHADFSESNPTKYHVWHPVVHTVGRGRFVGFGWGVMGHPFQVFLEGNPRFQIDSDADYFVEFTGAEDYFDAAWWFSTGMFTVPFAGFTDFIDAFYRFQYMDCYEFTRSFDFDMQPGNAEDVYDHFRTVGYYYEHWTPFWASRDTVIAGETWTLAGAGYAANTSLTITLGPQSLGVTTNDSGDFSITIIIPTSWVPDIESLSVAGETSPKKYEVLASPVIRPLVDTLPITLRAGDSLWVAGTGFHPGERVSFYFDSIPLNQSVVTDSNNNFVMMLRVPYVAEHSYYLVARGAISGNATSQDFIIVTRTIDLEFEDMMPPTYQTPSATCYAQNVSYFWEAIWSKQMYVYFQPDTVLTGAAVEFQFSIGHSDTFALAFHASVSPDQGRYAVLLDGSNIGTVDGYATTGEWNPNPLPSGALPLGIHYLSMGSHRIRFICLGKDDSATNYWIQPDNIVFTPTTYMAPTPGTILDDVTPPPAPYAPQNRTIQLFPNPNFDGDVNVQIALSAQDAAFFDARVSARVFDPLGRRIGAKLEGSFSEGVCSGTIYLANVPHGAYFVQFQFISPLGDILDLPIQPIRVE